MLVGKFKYNRGYGRTHSQVLREAPQEILSILLFDQSP